MAETDREQVVSLLRACALSMKGGVPVKNLNRDYKMLAGSEIPYQKLGYKTLEQFLKSVPDVSLSLGQGGEVILKAIPSKNTAHLAAMVSKQKSVSKKTRRSSRNAPLRRMAASLKRPPPSSVPMRASKHLPTDDTHIPLSITVNNRSESVECRSNEPARQVSFAVSSSKLRATSTEPTSSGSTGSELSHQKFEKPPRFLKLSQQGSSAPSAPAVASVPASAPMAARAPAAATVPAPTPAHTPVPVASVAFPVASSVRSKAQERLQQVKSTTQQKAKKNKLKLNLIGTDAGHSRAANDNHEVASSGGHSVASPITPLHARLHAAVQRPVQVQATSHQEEVFMAGSFGDGENFTKQLEEFAVSKGMSKPEYSVVPQVVAGKLSYSCFVTLDDFSISSYPEQRSSPGEAMNIAAKRALKEIENRSRRTQDKSLIMSRIAHIVAGHRSGIWSKQIPIDYNSLYSESLPDDWLEIMAKCPLVSVEQVAGNRIILTPNLPTSPTECTSPVVDAAKVSMETSYKQVPVSPVQSAVLVSPVQSAVPVSPVRSALPVSPVQPVVPEPITLPQDDVWDIYITYGSSTREIWGRLIGEDYSVEYENLATDMEMFYMEHVNVVPNPEIGSFYAIKMDDCWHRVELVEMNETCTKGWVFFIDHGDEEEVPLKELHLLEQRFARLPAQAVRCILRGLEDFADDPNVACHITDIIVGKALVASVKSLPSAKNPAVGVVLYDTSTEEDLNLNTMLLDCISKDAVAPQLPAEGKVAEVYISHVTDTGDVFLQFEGYTYVQSLVSSLIETCLKEANVVRGSKSFYPDPSRLYLARYHQDGNWYRAAITKKLDGQNEVEVIFVDFGNTEIVNPSELVLLETVKKSVAEFPHQAIKVRLHNVPYSSFSQRLRELVPFDERVLVKTISARPSNNIPVVEIFKRIQPDNLLVSINSTLAFEPDLKPLPKPTAGDGHSLRGRKRLERLQRKGLAVVNNCQSDAVSSGSSTVTPQHLSPVSFDSHDNEATSKGLSPPQIPAVGDYFDVHVTMAANPGNFTVQPYKDIIQLEEMMEGMQREYKEQKYPYPPLDGVKEGELYAALHHDGHWYRVCVTNVISENVVSVYFCDYGDVSVLPLDKLQPLTDQFKELPYQAIKAKLAGIQPKHSDWSVEDCLMFQELVVEHDFVSIIMEKGPDLLNPASMILGLRLIDTSGPEDVYIDELLVAQDRAVVRTAS